MPGFYSNHRNRAGVLSVFWLGEFRKGLAATLSDNPTPTTGADRKSVGLATFSVHPAWVSEPTAVLSNVSLDQQPLEGKCPLDFRSVSMQGAQDPAFRASASGIPMLLAPEAALEPEARLQHRHPI